MWRHGSLERNALELRGNRPLPGTRGLGIELPFLLETARAVILRRFETGSNRSLRTRASWCAALAATAIVVLAGAIVVPAVAETHVRFGTAIHRYEVFASG